MTVTLCQYNTHNRTCFCSLPYVFVLILDRYLDAIYESARRYIQLFTVYPEKIVMYEPLWPAEFPEVVFDGVYRIHQLAKCDSNSALQNAPDPQGNHIIDCVL